MPDKNYWIHAEKSAIGYPVLRDVQCIHPLVRKTEEGKTAFNRLCMHLTKVTKGDAFCDKAKADWLLYMCDSNNKLEQWIVDHESDCSDICSYWDYVTRLTDVAGDRKYKHVEVVVKSALSLSHGNAAPERGFSVNNSLLSKERLALGEETISAARVVKEAVKLFGSVTGVPVTKSLIACSRKAHAEYVLQLEKEKTAQKMKIEEQRKQELMKKELETVLVNKEAMCKAIKEQDGLETQQMQEQETAKQLINEAALKLSVSLKNNDMAGAKVAQVMLSAGNQKLQDTFKQLSEIRDEKQKCQQKLAKWENKERGHQAGASGLVSGEPAEKKLK